MEYLNSKYLSIQLSENARRIPRTTSYNQFEDIDIISTSQALKSSRPNTASTNNRIFHKN